MVNIDLPADHTMKHENGTEYRNKNKILSYEKKTKTFREYDDCSGRHHSESH